MNVIEVPGAFYISDVEKHFQIKESILKEIKNAGVYSFINKVQNIYNTDWHLNANFDRPYWDIFSVHATQHLEEIRNYLNFESIRILNYWFQQYKTGGFHEWHVHDNCTFSSVYFVELPEKKLSTSFKFDKNYFQVDVQEGQILTFPACYLHKSKMNNTDKTKTIISFNSCLGNYISKSSSPEEI